MLRSLLCALVFAAVEAPIAAAGDPPTTHDPNLYLFLDDHWVGKSRGLTRVIGEPDVMKDAIPMPDEPRTERDCAWANK